MLKGPSTPRMMKAVRVQNVDPTKEGEGTAETEP